MKTEKKTYALLIDSRAIKVDRSAISHFGTFEVGIIVVDEAGRVRNPGSYDAYEDLRFTCQWDTEKPTETTYGWNVRYRDVYSVDRQLAERMEKVFKQIDKAAEKFPVRPQSFGQYVALIAQGLGIKKVQKISDRDRGRSNDYSEMEFIGFKTSEAAWLIDNMISEAREPKEAQSTAE